MSPFVLSSINATLTLVLQNLIQYNKKSHVYHEKKSD